MTEAELIRRAVLRLCSGLRTVELTDEYARTREGFRLAAQAADKAVTRLARYAADLRSLLRFLMLEPGRSLVAADTEARSVLDRLLTEEERMGLPTAMRLETEPTPEEFSP